jgi:hypothetical protein
MMLRYRFIFALLIWFVVPVDGTAIYYKQYTTANSLISNNVYHSYRDSKGFMWFATDQGISKFDGQSFKNFTIEDGIVDNEVFSFYEDKAGKLWLYTYNGSYCYLRNDSIFNASNTPVLKQLPILSYINAMWSIDDTTLYFAYERGQVVKVSGTKHENIYDMRCKPIAMYMSAKGLVILGEISNAIIRGNGQVELVNVERRRAEFHNGRVLGSDAKGLKIYIDDRLVKQFDDGNLAEPNILHLYCDNEGNVFCSTWGGLFIVNYYTGKKYKLFQNLKVSSVLQDAYGNYWVTTLGNGVFCVNKELDKLKFTRDVNNAKTFIAANKQFFLLENDSLFRFNNAGNLENAGLRFNKNCEPAFINDNILIYTASALPWISYSHNGKFSAGKVPKKLIGLYSLYGSYYKHIYTYDKGFLFCSSHDVILNAGLKDNDFLFLDSCLVDAEVLATAYDTVFNHFYLMSGKGFYRYDPYSYHLTKLDSFTDGEVLVNMYKVDDKIILLANTNQLIVYRIGSTYKRHKLNTLDYVFYSIFSIDKNTYVVNTNKGYYVLYVDPDNFFHSRFKSIEYPFKASDILYIYPLGNDLLCNVNGRLYSFPKSLLNRELQKPIFFIDGVSVNGKRYEKNSIKVENAINCKVNLDINSLYFNNSKNSYQYRIIYNDKKSNWYSGGGNKLDILIPEPGVFKIDIRAITENNIASPIQTLSGVLYPPVYYTSGFKAVVILFCLLFFVSMVYLYNRRRKKLFENQLNYLQLEHKAINSLLNPHFIFNAINNIQSLVNEHKHERANHYLAMTSRLIRQNIENLQFNLISLEKELNLVESYVQLQNLRFNDSIDLSVNNDIGAIEGIKVPPLLVHTFVENAILHGFKSGMDHFSIVIDISASVDDYLIIKVTDNGVGYGNRSKADVHLNDKTSLGIDFTRKRLEKLSKFYKVLYSLDIKKLEENEGQGTEVLIILYAKFDELVPVH